jgi:hypothetical protein
VIVRIINIVDVIAFVYHGALTEKLGDEHTERLPGDAGEVELWTFWPAELFRVAFVLCIGRCEFASADAADSDTR